ncbi:MAG: hypothetical protein U1E70_19305 [Acetobacteraceae bacterium]|nr:hypothetical protein [Pseudomonadota bacterium]
MGAEFAAERRLLSEEELPFVQQSHYPALDAAGREDLIALARWLRAQRARARDIIHERRRLRRGKGEARAGATGAESERGLAAKKQVFARALKRVNHQIAILEARTKRARSVAAMQAAYGARQSATVHHPPGDRTPIPGMRTRPTRVRPNIVTGARIGSVSQAGRNAQAARDNRT